MQQLWAFQIIAIAFCIATAACKFKSSVSAPKGAKIIEDDSKPVPEVAPDREIPQKDTSYQKLKISPDCSEEDLSYQRLSDLAKESSSQIDFLTKKLPKMALQTFTIMYSSLSVQRHSVSKEWPGVIRMNADGTLMMRYVCDPKAEAYGKIETIRFVVNSDKTHSWKFSEFDFKKRDAGPFPEEDPESCRTCHEQASGEWSVRPNWADYPNWPGLFGGSDDYVPIGSPGRTRLDEFKDRHVFGTDANECYTSLPWPDKAALEKMPKEFQERWSSYPYDTILKSFDYHALRPNLKLTVIPSKLLALRNFERMAITYKETFELAKRHLALEALDCKYENLHAELSALVKSYKAPSIENAKLERSPTFNEGQDPRHSGSQAQALYQFSEALGFVPSDWTLVFERPNRSGYSSAGTNDTLAGGPPGDLALTRYVQAEIIKDVMKTVEPMREYAKYLRFFGEANEFGSEYACMDEHIAALRLTRDTRRAACEKLKPEAKRFYKEGPSSQTPTK